MQYFKAYEFKCPDGTDQCMAQEFLLMLDEARAHAGIAFVLTSAYRTPEYNAEVGGVKDSAHVKGLAVDIKVTNSHERFIILKSLLHVGFTRVGIGKDFIHVDFDTTKPPEVAWLY